MNKKGKPQNILFGNDSETLPWYCFSQQKLSLTNVSLYIVFQLQVLMKIRKSVKAYLDQPHARIPMLVIGTGVGAVSAAQGARIQDPTAKVCLPLLKKRKIAGVKLVKYRHSKLRCLMKFKIWYND